MNFFSCALLILFSSYSYSQYSFTTIDSIVINTSYTSQDVASLSKEICGDFKSDIEKARAFYTFIVYKVDYDYNLLNRDNTFSTPEEEDSLKAKMVSDAITTRKGICMDMSYLFYELCNHAGLTSKSINGQIKNINDNGEVHFSLHQWSAIYIDKDWTLVDCTQPKPKTYSVDYLNELFMVPPEIFIIDALPDDSAEQFLDKPINMHDIKQYIKTSNGFYRFRIRNIEPIYYEGGYNRKKEYNFSFTISNPLNIMKIEISINDKLYKTIEYSNKEIKFVYKKNSSVKENIQFDAVYPAKGFPGQAYVLPCFSYSIK